jgi:hypothetical protein
MSQQFGNFFNQKRPQTDGHAVHKPIGLNSHAKPLLRKPVFSKVFRWRLPDGDVREPVAVEVIGTFTNWKKVPLARKNAHDGWQVALNEIPSHRTHRYVILVDGKPVADDDNDGYAIPQGPLEQKYHLMTDHGPRVLMLFAQTK